MERSDEGTNPMLRNFCCPTDGVKDDSMVGCLPVVNNMVFDGMRYDGRNVGWGYDYFEMSSDHKYRKKHDSFTLIGTRFKDHGWILSGNH